MENKEAQHYQPAWSSDSDSVIGIKIKDAVYSEKITSEQLSAKEIDTNRFLVTCIPFFVYDLCLGDEVEVDNEWNVKRRTARGKCVGFRLFCKDEEQQNRFLRLTKSLGFAKDIYSESYSRSLMAVAVNDYEQADQVTALLNKEIQAGRILDFEFIEKADMKRLQPGDTGKH